MAQQANTGSLEQVLRCLQLLAQSAAYTTELQAKIAEMASPFVPGNFKDANGANFTLNITDTEFGGPAGWLGTMPNSTTPAFAAVQITDNLRPLPPFPRLLLIGDHGPAPLAEEREYREWRYGVQAVTITSGDADVQAVQRDAFVMVDAFESLVERNESLGGLVDLITADHPPISGGYGRIKNAGILAASMVHFRVSVRRASGL
jgi:hypothetical protein